MDTNSYQRSIELLNHIKLVQGPSGVYGTLRRHKDLQKSILEYQTNILSKIENDLDKSNL